MVNPDSPILGKAKLAHFELWEEPSYGSESFFPTLCREETHYPNCGHSQLGADAKLVWSVDAFSWVDAMQARYTYAGWGQYQPMLDEKGRLYPEDTECMLEQLETSIKKRCRSEATLHACQACEDSGCGVCLQHAKANWEAYQERKKV